jgi:hypothetical protein
MAGPMAHLPDVERRPYYLLRLSTLGPVYEPLNDIKEHVPEINAAVGSSKTSWTSHHPLYLEDVPDVR